MGVKGYTGSQDPVKTGTPYKKGHKGSQDLQEGGHSIQHQGGHLKIALQIKKP